MRRLHTRLAFLALHVIRDEVHRAGPIKRNERVEIFDVANVEHLRPAGHAAGFELENGDRLAFVEQIESRLIVERDRVDIEVRHAPPDQHHRIADDRQRFQSKKIHLQHADVAEWIHRVLTDDRTVVRARERDVFRKIAIADHDAGRVNTHASRQPFELCRDIPQRRGCVFVFNRAFQFGILVDRSRHMLLRTGVLVLSVDSLEGDAEFIRDHLRDPIRVAVTPAHHPAHVAHHGFRAERAEGDDLRHCAVTVFPRT